MAAGTILFCCVVLCCVVLCCVVLVLVGGVNPQQQLNRDLVGQKITAQNEYFNIFCQCLKIDLIRIFQHHFFD